MNVIIPSAVTAVSGRVAAIEDAYPERSAGGALAAVADAAPFAPRGLTVRVRAVQSGSGEPGPTNVRPISGFAAVNVYHTGKNMLDPGAGRVHNGVTFSVRADGSVYFVGTAGEAASNYVQQHFPAGSFLLSGILGTPAAQAGVDYVYRLQVSDWDRVALARASAPGDVAFQLARAQTLRCYMPNVGAGASVSGSVVRPMVRPAALADPTFEGYRGEALTVTFPGYLGTMYGAELDVLSGEMRVTHACQSFLWRDCGSVAALGTCERRMMPLARRSAASAADMEGAACSVAPFQVSWTGDTPHFYTNLANATVVLPAGTPEDTEIQIVYPLETPETFKAAPTALEMFRGCNALWSDAGEVALTYRADPALTLEGRLAEAEAMILENMGG